jgi:hypothetical protein
MLHDERREIERRLIRRRTNPANDPVPPRSKVSPSLIVRARPKAKASAHATTETNGDERRIADRRTGQRRSGGSSRSTAAAGDSSGRD